MTHEELSEEERTHGHPSQGTSRWATLTLLPAVLAKLGPRVDKLALPCVQGGEHRSPRFAAWAERLWRRPAVYGVVALGVAKWIFQDGALESLLGFQSQGLLDAWEPVFFFAMIFAISMDYTVFLLSSAKEHWDCSHEPREAMIGGVAHSGRVILAAAAVMVAVFSSPSRSPARCRRRRWELSSASPCCSTRR